MIKDIITNNESININENKINALKKIIPECFDRDGKIDVEKLKKELEDYIGFTNESYELNFLGKSYAKLISSLETETVIVPDEDNESELNKNSKNIYITGDNLDALKHLVKAYKNPNKIKCIYIDPPYNTGSDGFVYNDSFKFDKESLIEKLDVSEEEAERILNMTSSNSSSHSAWLTFMYPRLYLAREILSDDGAIFISIGDDEVNNLKILTDSIFGEENFVALCPRKTRGSATTKSNAELQKLNDYVLIYLKNRENAEFKLKVIGQKEYPYEDERGKYYTVPLQDNGPAGTRTARPNLYYPIYLNKNGDLSLERKDSTDIEYLPDRHRNDDGRWMWSKEKFNNEHQDLCINKDKVCIKHYYKKDEDQNKYEQERNWLDKFQNSKGTNDLNDLFEEKGLFSNPKPVELIEFLINLIADDDSIILDFFGGSGSTAEAVMKLNSLDNGNRKFILVQLPENLEENLQNAGKEAQKQLETQISFLKSINKPLYLDEIGQERIRRASKKIKNESDAKIDYGFKHYTLKNTSDKLLNKLVTFNPDTPLINDYEEILNEYGKNTILTTWKLNDGYSFDKTIETIKLDNYEAYKCDDCLYFINPNITIKDIQALLNIYNNDSSFNCSKIIVFGYSLKLDEIEIIKTNIKQVKNFKNIDVKIYTRY